MTVKLQRRVKDASETEWKDVEVTDREGKKTTVITLEPDYQDNWKHVFSNLDRYDNYTNQQKKPYEYRVVEVVKDGKTYKELKTEDYFNDCFKVQSYSENVSVDESDNSTKVDKIYTITNVYSPKTNIKITKVDASDENKKLDGVEFTLEKLKFDTNGKDYVKDDEFVSRTQTTSGKENNTSPGIAEFTDLPDGRYRLTETKAKAGYSLLKDPITIVIDRTGTTVDNETYTFGNTDDTKNTISIQIKNRKKFLLPTTGGYGPMLFILCGMALATLGCLITLRKEVQYSRLKRQRRNAIGK